MQNLRDLSRLFWEVEVKVLHLRLCGDCGEELGGGGEYGGAMMADHHRAACPTNRLVSYCCYLMIFLVLGIAVFRIPC